LVCRAKVNCETDFVGASDGFNKLVSAVAMQVAASPTVSLLLSF
jgi:translation elongation factor EF-Ts